MKVVLPTNTTHSFKFIPRIYPTTAITLYLKNETTKIETSVANIYSLENGILDIEFDFTFAERDKYQIRILEGANVIYRGKLFATTQDTQEFKIIKNYINYE